MLLTFTANVSGTYYIDVGSSIFHTKSGQYGVSVAEGSKATVDVSMGAGIIDYYIDYNELDWTSTPGTGATLTVGFRGTDDNVPRSIDGFLPFFPAQVDAAIEAASYFNQVSGLYLDIIDGYYVIDDRSDGDATILLSNYDDDDERGAFTIGLWEDSDGRSWPGDVYVNLHYNSFTDVAPGTYEFLTIMHEMGHAVGLSHPGEYAAGEGETITFATDALFVQDTLQYTVMSYFSETFSGADFDGTFPDTLMLYDIRALQQIYGVNYATRSGDTTYGFNANDTTFGFNFSLAGTVYDFTSNTDPVLCIWDGGGIDTIDCSGFSDDQTISLLSGTFSDIGGLTGNVSIALGAVIENAVGGSGSDTIIGNVSANILDGGAGEDTLAGGPRDDIYYVDHPNDKIIEFSSEGYDTVFSTASYFFLDDYVEKLVLTGIEDIDGYGNALENTLIGNSGDNVLSPLSGADTMEGGDGDDVYSSITLAIWSSSIRMRAPTPFIRLSLILCPSM